MHGETDFVYRGGGYVHKKSVHKHVVITCTDIVSVIVRVHVQTNLQHENVHRNSDFVHGCAYRGKKKKKKRQITIEKKKK